MRHVYLKLVDRMGRGLLLEEVRGAIHGGVDGWFEAIDTTAQVYEIRNKDDIAPVRAREEALNAECTPG